MPSKKNIEQLNELAEIFSGTEYMVATQYKSVSVNDMVSLRKSLNAVGAKYRIIKNNIAYLAAEKAGISDFKEYISGTCAIMISNDDPAQSSKELFKSIKTNDLDIKILGGILNGNILEAPGVEQLSKLPSKQVLIANVIGQIGAPITGFVYTLSSQISSLVSVLSNITEAKQN